MRLYIKNKVRKFWFDFGVWLFGFKYFFAENDNNIINVGFFTSKEDGERILKLNVVGCKGTSNSGTNSYIEVETKSEAKK